MDIIVSDIKAKAENLGFSFIDFTALEQTPHFDAYQTWLGKNQNGDLVFLGKEYVIESRKDPTQLMANGQTMIILGVLYGQAENFSEQNHPLIGKIAAYAQYEDYHAIIKSKARELMDTVNSHRDKKINYKIFLDSGPVMEKDFAFKTGLGWIGRNSLFIHPVFGSFTLLCCIVIDEPIVKTAVPCEDLCGDCKLCIEACPMQCISDDHTINASRCISYLTIEHEGLIERNLRNQIGDWIFGCDVCQNICPRNNEKLVNRSNIMFGLEKIVVERIDLLTELKLTEPAFLDKYGKTPISRISLEQFQRNLIISAGNSHDKIFIDAIKLFLTYDSEILRATAVWALAEIEHEEVIFLLQKQMQIENCSIVKDELLNALVKVT